MVLGKRRQWWWLGLVVGGIIALYFYGRQAIIQNDISLTKFIAGSFVDWSGLLLLALPTRLVFARWIGSRKLELMALGLFFGGWLVCGVAHLAQVAIAYYMFNWPEQVWITLIPLVPLENLLRAGVGTVIGIGVISGLRAIGLIRAREAIY